MHGGYEGGWLPSTYITGDVPIGNVYLNKKNHEYMDIRDWAIGSKRMKKPETKSWGVSTFLQGS